MSSKQRVTPQSEQATTPGEISPSPTDGFVKLEASVSVIETQDDDIVTVEPARAKALISPMRVTHDTEHVFTVQTPRKTYTVDTSEDTCSCPSTLPEHGQLCEHLHHVYERSERGRLPGPVTITQPVEAETEAPERGETGPGEADSENGRSITCPHCDRGIGETLAIASQIEHATCNVCALENDEIYHLDVNPDDDPELVYFSEMVCSGNVGSFYPDSSTMSVYEFFQSHPNVTPSDTVVRVHRRVDAPDCSGLLFESPTTAVPGSVLSKAIEALDSEDNTEQSGEPAPDAETVDSETPHSLIQERIEGMNAIPLS